MSSRLTGISGDEAIQAFVRLGYEQVRQKGGQFGSGIPAASSANR